MAISFRSIIGPKTRKATSVSPYKRAALAPLVGCWINTDWRERGQAVPYVLRSGPNGLAMATYMIDNGFFSRLWGYGNAIAVILFVISFVAALLFQRMFLRRDLEGALTSGRVH